ncbi:MAG: potassium-transporting ATPase subunit KdpA [Akkermansia sp.]
MSSHDLLIIGLFIGVLLVVTPILGSWMAKVLTGQQTFLSRICSPLERFIYQFAGISPQQEMNWKQYALAVLYFNLSGFAILYLTLLTQGCLPLNPTGAENMRWDIAFNTAMSFTTNTNWQFYSGEGPQGVSYLTQMTGMCVQNFVSAATGIAVMAAIIRGFKIKCGTHLGNFGVDVTRITLYILLPLATILTMLLISQGTVQSLNAPINVSGLEQLQQTIPSGPAASQIAIKHLGTNGGGFFGCNSAHPFENPTGISNFLEMAGLLIISCACTYAFGQMIGSKKQGWIIFGAMLILLITMICLSQWAEHSSNPLYPGVEMMEGKEVRLGITNSSLFSVVTTVTSTGAVNCMHSSLSPLAGGIALFNMLLGEIIFGGVGSGLYGMLLFAIVTVFLSGLMVGRTPEFLGKKIEALEVRWAMIGILITGVTVLILSSIAAGTDVGRASLLNNGPHGLSEILYCFGSQANNNGSAFAGLGAGDTPFYSVLGGIAMFIGRLGAIIPVLIIAGSMAAKKISPPAKGTMRTDNLLFIALLIAVILVVGALTFFPFMALGPILENLLMYTGISL